MKKVLVYFAAITCIIFSSLSIVSAQSVRSVSYEGFDNFDTQVLAMVYELPKLGYSVADYDIVEIKEGEEYTWDLTYQGDREYTLIGYTEEGFKDLGLYFYGADGDLVTIGKESKLTSSQSLQSAIFYTYFYSKGQIIASNIDSKRSRRKYKMGLIIAYRDL